MAVNYFLKLDGVPGEVADVFHQNQIRLLNWSWRTHNLSSVTKGGGSGAGKVNFDDFTFMSHFDRSSTQVFKRICMGMHIGSGIVTAEKAGALGLPWLEMKFKRLFITNIENAASWEIPAVTVAFSFEQVTIEYKIQKSDGCLISTGPITYNRKENKLS
jgi:type VI secretion system secreted protein Hcp